MSNTPIYNSIKKYLNNDPVVFHMPGHKLKKKILQYDERVLDWDLTEIEGLDNLAYPSEAILEAETLASNAFGSSHTFFSVNGSTLGIHTAIRTVCKRGDKIIVQRNSHKSVFSGINICGVNPKYIYPVIDKEFGICLPITLEQVKEAFENNMDAVCLILTSPCYYGLCVDVKEIADYIHSIGKLLIIDEAHGSHFNFNQNLPISSVVAGADIVVQSSHKTLPAPTQTGLIHISEKIDKEYMQFCINEIQTTSPSYILMAGIDIARDYMEREGEQRLEEVIGYVDEVKKKLRRVGYKVLENDDKTRLVINTSNGKEVERILMEEYNIQVEMSDQNNIVCICTVMDDKEDLDTLYIALEEMNCVRKEKENISYFEIPNSDRVDISDLKNIKQVKYIESLGSVSADYIMIYPPGIPFLCPGEIITGEHIEKIKEMIDIGVDIKGIDNQFVLVYF